MRDGETSWVPIDIGPHNNRRTYRVNLGLAEWVLRLDPVGGTVLTWGIFGMPGGRVIIEEGVKGGAHTFKTATSAEIGALALAYAEPRLMALLPVLPQENS